ncbi:DUF2500 domain-containing protein [Fictibacillus sp. NRS-1165]|uniref:DUF2500 domain-containing protein n=1 Tax=Fictibacillus sp. NRS-1165 TaxID=3144463 RepID=UPI003D19926B
MLDDPTGDFMFQFVPILIGIIAIIVISTIVIGIVKGAAQWNHNNNSPVFQLEDGERIELRVKGQEYCMPAEGDTGELSFQGTRYLGFNRSANAEIN